MGNICSKSSNQPDAFSSPGRVLGSGPNPPAKDSSSAPRAPLPSNAKPASNWGSGPSGRTLGSPAAGEGNGDATADARTKAALAAQANVATTIWKQKRAESASAAGSKGKLGTKLAAQKAQTQNQTLNEASRDEVAARDADGAAEARRWQ
ncbi:hypothetical protein RIB2604_02901660 [Aspergillus luchuensis]|uniref:Uncharacterized protein n=1 Tax=Aspergillus kawachii TaxID=1069201 RepID=A0A146FUL1_ASPKA|nr:hypothetical protein RIB2604_02901660 [Aspergillus luchuensis]